MVTLHPNIIEKSGKKEFVVLSYEEFLMIQEELENFDDLKALRKAKRSESSIPGLPLSAVRKKLKPRVRR
jgi:PHD/YefM family antitoxin component YafN of YafNO toxin-antitoxin module